jgi:TPR repeat protein
MIGLFLLVPSADADQDIPVIEVHPARVTVQELMERGVGQLRDGNISAARRLIEPAADANVPQAARYMGETYDPVWLAKHNAIGIDGLADPMTAIRWYQRAAQLGDLESQKLISGGQDNEEGK